MALSVSLYNQTRRLLAVGDVNFNSLRIMLRDSDTNFNPGHTVINNLSGLQVSGNGWPNGGVIIPNTAIVSSGSDAVLLADDVEVTATGGSIGPIDRAIIVDEQDRLILFIQFVEEKEAVSGTPFSFLWSDGVIIRWE